MKTQLIISIKVFVVLTVLCGIAYPLLVTGIAQLAFSEKANGSLIVQGNKVVGSVLIGQKFDQENYFWSRPSATDYSAMPSGGSNLGPSSEKLKQQVAERKTKWNASNPDVGNEPIPSEMLLASASGLDPHISLKAALLQVDRIVKARQLSNEQKQQLVKTINELTETPQFSLLGEQRINVLKLNLGLDKLDNKMINHN